MYWHYYKNSKFNVQYIPIGNSNISDDNKILLPIIFTWMIQVFAHNVKSDISSVENANNTESKNESQK